MRSHFQFPESYTSKLAVKARSAGLYCWNRPIERHLPGDTIHCDGQPLINLAGYSYLGFITDTELRKRAEYALNDFGLGTHGARPNCGTTVLHKQLEKRLSETNGSQDTVLYPSGYQANISTISALVKAEDVILSDEFNHASIIDGCRLAGSDVRIFKHNDLSDLKEKSESSQAYRNRLVIVDSIYSMDGDLAPIPDLCQLCDDYKAVLMVDEAHTLGVLGEHGFGVVEHFGLGTGDIDVITGVLSKAVPGTGGYASGSNDLGEYLRNNARGYIFSGAVSPYTTAVALEALAEMTRNTARVKALWRNTYFFHKRLRDAGANLSTTMSPVTPIIFGEAERSMQAAKYCMDNGVFIIAVPYPVVPKGTSRLRATVTAALSLEDLETASTVLLAAIKKFATT